MKTNDFNSELKLMKESDVKPDGIEVSVTKKQMPVEKELLTKRGVNSKTFLKKKGKYETIYYNSPIHHYDDHTNAFVEISKKVIETEDRSAFCTRGHELKVTFPKQEDGNVLFSMNRGDYRVTLSLKSSFGKQFNLPMPILDQKRKTLSYVDAIPGADIDCALRADSVNLTIKTKDFEQKERYSFVVTCSNLKQQWNESEKALRFLSTATDEMVFEISPPSMMDHFGSYSENVSFEVIAVNEQECELTFIPDLGWLSAKERVYPIKMGFAMNVEESECRGIEFDHQYVSADGKIPVGGASIPFKMYLPERRADVITKKVKVLFHCDSVPIAENKDYVLALSKSVVADKENCEVVSQMIGVNTMRVGKAEYAFDVTSEYAADENTTYALQLCEKQNGELVVTSDAAVALMTVSADSAIATYSVTETDGTTDEDSSSGESGNIGSVGTYEVDLSSGKLNMEMKDFAWGGNRMPISIIRSYQGVHAGSSYDSWNDATGIYQNMKIGSGWRMNLMQSMVNTGYQNIDNVYRDTYTYIDESGEETLFRQCECESGSATCTTYEDVSGLGYTYDAGTGILKKGTETHTFVRGHLVKIEDEFGNAMFINYASDRITSVKDGVGRIFTFSYDGNFLISITAPNGSSVLYGYCGSNLCCVTYPNGQTVNFTYESDVNPPDSILVSGNHISSIRTNFTYDSGLVQKITTVSNGVVSEKHTEFSFEPKGKQTIVTEVDGADGAEDQIKLHKISFNNHSDKNYSYYESGSENKIQILDREGEILPYTDAGMATGNMRCQNLLKKHNFDLNVKNLTSSDVWQTNLTGDYCRILADPAERMPGYCAAYLVSLLSDETPRGIWQTVTLRENTSYVFSCYLKLDMFNSNPARGVYLMVKSADGNFVRRSRMITDRGGFMRVALPFTVDASHGLTYTVGIYLDGNVKAKAIAPQLEEGNYLSPYNYLGYDETVKVVGTTNSGDDGTPVAKIKVSAVADGKETFTLSGYAQGKMTYSQNEGEETYAALKAIIHYVKTAAEKNSDAPCSEFEVPIYTKEDERSFAMVQFSKDQYRAIDYVEIFCDNKNNPNEVTFTDLQLIRNSYIEGMTEEDFAGAESDVSEDYTEAETALMSSSSSSDADDEETITFEEVLDAFGNALTGTNFKNGELGAIYTEQKFADSNLDDAIGDAGNNKTEEVDARGNATKYEYDPVTSKPTKVTDRCGNATSYTYDTAGRTTGVTAPNGGTVSYGYNSYDDLTQITRGDGQTYTMGYDAYRNLTSVKIEGMDKNLVTYDYKTGGNRLKSMTYANGAVQSLTYDRFGNVIGEAWNGVMAYRYFYDASNQLVKTLDISNQKMYNMNRVGENVTSIEEYDVGEIDTTTYIATGLTLVGTMHYSFDSNGKQFRKKYVAADGTEQKYVFEYQDEQNVAVQLPTGVVSHAKSDHLGRKVFDELQLGKGLMNRMFTYHEGVITPTHEANDKKVSDPQTTLVKQIEFADGRTIQYEYDAEERITQVIDTIDGVETKTVYTYDALGQLLTETVNGVEVNRMTYDQYGNIATKNGKTYTYDTTWRDKLLSTGDGSISNYDLNGNPQSYLDNALAWEKGRQLKAFGANTYKYNNEGIRIKKTTSTEIHEYILDGTNIVKEIVSDICNCPKYTNEYLYDLDGTVCGIKHNGTAYYFYKNLQGDVIAITDDEGATIARYTYDAWGKMLSVTDANGANIPKTETHIANINPFRYRSYYYDTETGLYYLQSRYYNPEVGRFINADQEDLFAENGVVLYNKYCYAQNNPVNNKDDSGAAIVTIVKKVLDVILSIAGGLAGMYLADVLSNIIQGKKDYTQPVQSPGAYLAEAVRSAGIAIFGSKLLQRIILAIGVTAVKALTDMIAGRKVTIWSILGDLFLNLLLTVLACNGSKFMKQLKKVKNKKAVENKFKQCIASIAQHLVSFFKSVWQGLQSCIQMFYKRFSLKMFATFAMNILNMIR